MDSFSSASVRHRDKSDPLRATLGFSVVAPMSVTTPFSKCGSSASCCDLLNLWISSRNSTVRFPNMTRLFVAVLTTCFKSATPA